MKEEVGGRREVRFVATETQYGVDDIMESIRRHGRFLAFTALHFVLSVVTTIGTLILFGIGMENHIAEGIVEGFLIVYAAFRFPLLTLVDVGALSGFHTPGVSLEYILVPSNSVIAGYGLTRVAQLWSRRFRSPEQ